MNRREIDRLLWELIDGEIAPEDRARLEAHLAADAAARERLAEMRSLAQLLAAVEEVPAPDALPADVARAVASKRGPRIAAEVRAPWLEELFTPRWRVRLAWAAAGLALGIAAGILAVSDLRKPAVEDVSRFYGAMTQGGEARGLRLALTDATGMLTVSRDGATLLVELVVDRPRAAPVILVLDGNRLALKDLQSVGDVAVEVDPEGDRIALTLDPVGRSLLSVTTSGEDALIGVRVTAAGRLLLERAIRVGEVPAS